MRGTIDQLTREAPLYANGAALENKGKDYIRAVIEGVACGPQVQQYRWACILQKDVVGRDVAVQGVSIVQGTQSAQHGPQHLA